MIGGFAVDFRPRLDPIIGLENARRGVAALSRSVHSERRDANSPRLGTSKILVLGLPEFFLNGFARASMPFCNPDMLELVFKSCAEFVQA